MESTTFGSTEMEVSEIRLDYIDFGSSDWQQYPWVLKKEESHKIADN